MPGFLLDSGATLLCAHGGQARPVSANARVTVAGVPVVSIVSSYVIAGCALPPTAGGPCVSAQFVTAATRVTSQGEPLLLSDSQAVCEPTGTPLVVIRTQTRVRGA